MVTLLVVYQITGNEVYFQDEKEDLPRAIVSQIEYADMEGFLVSD